MSQDDTVVQNQVDPMAKDEVPARVHLVLDGKDHVVPYLEGRPLLDSALEGGLQPPFSCRAGACSACKARLLKGRVRMGTCQALESSDLKQHYILTCQAKCLSPEIKVSYDE